MGEDDYKRREKKGANRLLQEKSPYLLQHAYNPVDWFPWGPEAFERAEVENKPVFLSIGYSTCHWCHVMEKESFEDPEVAAAMNDAVIAVKVDREERPDLDHVYMAVCQALTGRGGWPLTLLLTPEKMPFFAGTYIPKGSRYGQPGMIELLKHIKTLWRTRRDTVIASSQEIVQAMKGLEEEASEDRLDPVLLDRAFEDFLKRFDPVYGGFGQAPKFPSPHNLIFLLRYWKRTGKADALDMVRKTLKAMRYGGIYDHIGYGFHRYSTDREWRVPHFEKMLYDQAMLALAYLEAYQAAGDRIFAETAAEIFTYVLRDMTAPEGGFYSAEDADSEGVEGKFYLWREEEIGQALAPEAADEIVRTFGVASEGNFLEEASRTKTGANILYLSREPGEVFQEPMPASGARRRRLEEASRTLLALRDKRARPHLDDKVLTDWNGLMIAALARGGRILGDSRYVEAAAKASRFLLTRMRSEEGHLFHRYREGEVGIPAHLDDYAFFVWGLTELFEATQDPACLEDALGLAETMLARFWDPDHGGLFFTPIDGEPLILKRKEAQDGAIPSGNGVAMHSLLTLGRLTGRPVFEERAHQIGQAFEGQIRQMPSAFSQFLTALEHATGSAGEVIVVGPSGDPGTEAMLGALERDYAPNLVRLFKPTEPGTPPIEKVIPMLEGYTMVEGKATAYVCREGSCTAPTTDPEDMVKRIGEKKV